VRVQGRWCYRYRAMDAEGKLVDSMLSATRDMGAAQRFFTRAREVVGHAPEKVTTDGHDSYPRAVRETLGPTAKHRTNQYLNNRLEQDHRGIKQRYYPMRGFGSFEAAARFCTAHDELRDHFRSRQHLNETVPLAEQRRLFKQRWGDVCALLRAV
jgi:putative transposase